MAPRRPVEKLSRRAGVELGLKGTRQVAGKSGRIRRPYPPGQQGRGGQQGRRRKRDSDYLLQLREKQKVQWFYGVAAGQLARYFDASRRRPEATGEELLRQLEQRLDNIVYRLGFAGTRAQARQFVSHGHVLVNGSALTAHPMKSGQARRSRSNATAPSSRSSARRSVLVSVFRNG